MLSCWTHWIYYFRIYILAVAINMALWVIHLRKITNCSRNRILYLIQLCWIVLWKRFSKQFTSCFSETQRISGNYFGNLAIIAIV
jgi:hypothetical protein